jgi:hypothetical protein
MSTWHLSCLSLCPVACLSACDPVCLYIGLSVFFLSLTVYNPSYPSCSLLSCIQVSARHPACPVCLSFNDSTCVVRLSPCLFDNWYVCLSDSLACCHSCSLLLFVILRLSGLHGNLSVCMLSCQLLPVVSVAVGHLDCLSSCFPIHK